MTYVVSITSQGQISIPADIRRALGLDRHKKAVVRREGDKVIVEPVRDFLELEGVFKHKAIKGKSIDEIMRLEEEAVAEAVADRYRRKLKRMK